MKKRILSLVLCAALLLSLCLFMGAGVTGDTYKVTVNYIYESDSSPVGQATVLQVAKDEALNKEIMIPTQLNYTPTLAGGTPSGITLDPATGILKFTNFKPTENVTVKVLYVAGNATYTVNHYLQNLNDDEYTLDKSVELTGSIDAYTQAAANKYEGFTASEITQTPIAADNTTAVDIYYTRNYYMVQFAANGGVNGPEPIYAKYGTTYALPDGPTKAGYRFAGWFDSEGRQVTEGIVKANVTYTAGWTHISDKAGVTVVYWGQNANDDEYSYYGAAVLTDQNVGGSLAWNDVKNLTAYTCGLEEHTHTADCGITCVHTGSHAFALSCVGLDGAASVDPNQYGGYGDHDARTHFEDSCTKTDDCKKAKLKKHLKNGSVCQYKNGYLSGRIEYYYFLYFDGAYYKISSELYNQLKSNTGAQVTDGHDTYYVYEWNGQCLHKHADACYDCGKITHTHTDSCKSALDAKMDSSLWTYEKSDTVTVDAAGNTIMNVYYTRKVFTLHFRQKNSSNDDYGTIQARWGKDIAAKYNEVVKKAGSSFWSERKNAGEPWTNYIGVMPQRDITYYRYTTSGSESTMTYYGEDLNGNYQEMFSVTFNGNVYVTSEDRYEFEGFTYHHGTSIGDSCNGAKFYYKRNTYSLNFYSASSSQSDSTKNVKFQEPLGSYDYTPTSKPKSVEPDAVFAGWYLNPQCTGEQYVLSEHKMPSNNIALYAKWVNRSYTVTTYTDDTLKTLYEYDGYTGSQSVVKYEKGVAPTNPTKSGYVFVGWFYKEDGVEKPFSFEMGVTKNYDLYPKWSNEVNVNYTIKYVVERTGDELGTDTGSARIGSSVTVKSKHFEGFFPKTTSTSVQIDQEGQVITLYYVPATEQTYTVKYVELVNEEPRNIADSETKTTSDQQVVVAAKDIEGFTPDKYQKTLELTAGGENVVTFYYTKQVTINYVPLEGGSVTPATETLIRTTGEARGSTATPNPSYKFVGWYNNRECTGNPVSTDAKFVPQQVNGVYEEATYYAKFELDVFDLTITKAGENIDQNQIFVFHVVSDDHKTDMEVTVQGTSSVKIKGLPLGTTYTVTEDTGWTWQYTPDSASKTIMPDGDSMVTFTNTYSKPNWLTSFAEVINKWINGQIKQTEIKN